MRTLALAVAALLASCTTYRDTVAIHFSSEPPGADVVVDGTDNAETRYLLNDACVKLSIPWVYGGAVEATAVAMAVGPGRGPCLRCAFPDPPDPGSLPTARTAGVLNTAVAAASTWQTAEVLRFLVTGQAHWGRLTRLDTWTGETVAIEVERDPDCPCCGQGRYEFLHS